VPGCQQTTGELAQRRDETSRADRDPPHTDEIEKPTALPAPQRPALPAPSPQEMLNFSRAKGIKPLIEKYKLSNINEAAARVASGKARYRVVMETDAI
jgi:hypothetical protein